MYGKEYQQIVNLFRGKWERSNRHLTFRKCRLPVIGPHHQQVVSVYLYLYLMAASFDDLLGALPALVLSIRE